MKATYALYSDPLEAGRAVESLKASGIPDDEIVIMSPEPLGEYDFGQRDSKTSMRWAAIVGGVIGCVAGASMTSLTQLFWPLRTGGMPIVSVWPNLIVAFELTMLGAIAGTAIAFVNSAGLGRRLPTIYDPSVSDGKILIGVANPSEAQISELKQALAGGEFKTIA